MIENYDAVLREMQAAGLRPKEFLIGTGKTQRCAVEGSREKRGWYLLSVHRIGDADYLVGAYGIWHGRDNGKVAVVPKPQGGMSQEQREAVRARITADAARAKKQREQEAERAALEAAKVWRAYLPTGEHGYLKRKGISAHGVRFHPKAETIAVPMLDTQGRVWGLQLIRGADRGDRLEKQFWPRGCDPVGRFFLIGGAPRDLLILVEGFATGATVHEAIGVPVAVAFSAGNLLAVARALRRQYPRARILLCADDDYRTPGNPGLAAAQSAALAVDGQVLAPVFTTERPQDHKGPTDWNDLHVIEGLHVVRSQIGDFLTRIQWLASDGAALRSASGGAGELAMVPRLTVDEAVARYWGTYGMGGKALFDRVERRIVHKDDVCNLLPQHGWNQLRDHPEWRVVRDWEIGFDPTEADPAIKANLFGGWPTVPKAGRCTRLLELLERMCSGEPNGYEIYEWTLNWLAYPLQRRGAKMHSALVFHGPQGTGKNLFFEAVMQIYGKYGIILGQEALEDRFNSDWSEAKLFVVADEILARQDVFDVKNRIKGLITGRTLRVNPKNVAAHNERNHMNFVFLSNERRPLILENDDRRHLIVWIPPKIGADFYIEVAQEIADGGVAALHDFLLNRDLAGFDEASRPPMTSAKADLIDLGTSNEERFVKEWSLLEIPAPGGGVLPFCPCSGAHLYGAYRAWAERNGERVRRLQDLVGFCAKNFGWTAGRAEWTWTHFNDRTQKRRKMVVPSARAIEDSITVDADQARYRPDGYASRAEWLTVSYFDFARAAGREDEA